MLLPTNCMLQALHVLLLEECLMLLQGAARDVAGGVHDAVANHLLLQALHVLLLEEYMMLLLTICCCRRCTCCCWRSA